MGRKWCFFGKELGNGPNYSDAVAEKIDKEIGSLLQKAQETAKKVLEANRARLTYLANRLLTEETIEGPDLQKLLVGSSPAEAPLAAD